LINVGGEKVYPTEIETVIQELDNVADVTVYSEKNLITGNIICAKVTLIHEEDKNEFTKRLKLHCLHKLDKYKVPVKVVILDNEQFSQRFKKIRH
jgi:long-chain acyl-CoA synthetase